MKAQRILNILPKVTQTGAWSQALIPVLFSTAWKLQFILLFISTSCVPGTLFDTGNMILNMEEVPAFMMRTVYWLKKKKKKPKPTTVKSSCPTGVECKPRVILNFLASH